MCGGVSIPCGSFDKVAVSKHCRRSSQPAAGTNSIKPKCNGRYWPKADIGFAHLHFGGELLMADKWLDLAPRPGPLPAGKQWHVFLSYRSVNRPWVLALYDVLNVLGYK